MIWPVVRLPRLADRPAPRWRPATRAAARWRTLAPFVMLLLLMFGCAWGGMLAIARETDAIDTLRTRETLTAALEVRIRRVQAVASDNASALAAMRAAADPIDVDFIESQWTRFTAADQVDTVLVLDADGRALIGYRDGRRLSDAAAAAIAAAAQPIARRLPPRGEGSISALATHGIETGIFGVANLSVGMHDRSSSGDALPTRRLVMAQRMGPIMLKRINQVARVTGLRFGGDPADRRSVSAPIYPGGRLVLTWPSRGLGEKAMRRAIGYIIPSLALGTLLLGVAVRSSLQGTRALERLALEDRLTGLPNRPAFMAALERALRRGGGFALGMIDLDGFKAVNDTHGHLAGDDVLRALGIELAALAPPGVFVARLAGDEFAFLAPSLAIAEATGLALKARLVEPVTAGPLMLCIGAAVGIAEAQPGMGPRDLIALADARLYRDKAAGRAAGTPLRLPAVAVAG